MTIQLNLTDLKASKALLNLLKKLKYVEVHQLTDVEKQVNEAKLEHDELVEGMLFKSKAFWAEQ